MSRRLRRLPAALLPLVLAATLAACGSDSSAGDDTGSTSSDALHGISVSGEIGSAPEVAWDGKLEVDETETAVVTEGEGAKVAEGDQVQVNIWVGNGFTQKQAYSSYDDGGQAETVTASDQLAPVFKDAILGQTIGSRVAVTAPAADAFGEAGNPQMGIGNKDTVLIVVDLMEMYQPPTPQDVPAAQLPRVVEKKGKPVGLDFTGVDKPKTDGDLLRSVVKKGDGETVTTDMTLTVNYLGAVYDADAPFDESYSKEPASFPLTQVVQGWTYGLEGVKVGSRVLLQIPPALGYGADESNPAIPANSTLYFVVDIIDAE